MTFMINTNVAIMLRDGDAAITARIGALTRPVVLSIITRVELEGGVYREPAQASVPQSASGRVARDDPGDRVR